MSPRKTRNVGENIIKIIPSTFWKFGKLFLDSGDREESLIIGRLRPHAKWCIKMVCGMCLSFLCRKYFHNPFLCAPSVSSNFVVSQFKLHWCWVLGLGPSEWYIQKQQPPIGAPVKRCSENMQKIYRRTPMPRFDIIKVAIAALLKLHFNMGVLL